MTRAQTCARPGARGNGPGAATYTLRLSPGIVTRLQALTARYNGDNGAQLTVEEWLLLHVREIAVQDELLAVAQALAAQAQKDVDAAIVAEKQRLIESQ